MDPAGRGGAAQEGEAAPATRPQGRGPGRPTDVREQAAAGIKGARKKFGGARTLADQE